jgi:orotidine-5'-phosphate decarboxylase
MKNMSFMEKLRNAWERNNSLVCVGLDPDLSKLPECLKNSKQPIFDFNKALIDATADLVCCYKPQCAYYSGQDAEDELKMTMKYLKEQYPEVPVILDAKRGDIGPTAMLYAKEAFEIYNADAVTVNPYMGLDTLKPFMDWSDRGTVILCRTSNPSSREIQELKSDGKAIYEHVAEMAQNKWNYNHNILLVIGATFPEELKQVREICPAIPFLVPGVGAQGGDVELVIRNGKDKAGKGLIINSSRGIIYADSSPDFANAARRATLELRDLINQFR